MDNPFLATPAAGGNVVLDLDGVVFLGADAIPGAGEALIRMAEAGWSLTFATNNATRSRQYLVDRIEAQTGYGPDASRIVTSAMSAARMIGDDGPVFMVGELGLRTTLEEAGIVITDDPSSAGTVVVALDRGFTYDRLEAASTAIRGGARFIATNSDVTFPTPAGQVPGAGSIVAAVAAAAGRAPEFAGKPHPPMVRAVESVLVDGDVWMIGDRPETDLAFARTAGWRSILALSGVTADAATVPVEWAPDLVVASLAELVPAQ